MNQIHRNNQNPSVLALLRMLVPNRELGYYERLRIAELQANRLRAHFALEGAPTPEEIIEELPRIRVIRKTGLPVSGAAHWNGHYWIITLNSDEPDARQRFSLMHEFKHVLDHTSKNRLYRGTDQAERIADYFAACLLMPKRVVKSLWCQGAQDINQLARTLGVSPVAMRYRLQSIGLVDRPARCTVPSTHRARSIARPHRPALSMTGGAR